MKRIAYVWLAATILAGTLTTLAGAQSEPLGDYARAVRKEKKQEKLESGAQLLQIYTGYVYRGPSLLREIMENASRPL